MLSKIEIQNHSEARKKAAKGSEDIFEFCCSENSSLGKIYEEKEIMHFRLTKESNDLSDPEEITSLQKMLKQFPSARLWGSLPCDPWLKWQALNIGKYGSEFAKRLKKKRQLSRKMLKHFLETTEQVFCQGGHIAFEWPKGAKGWQLPELTAFVKKYGLYIAECHDITSGWKIQKGIPSINLGTSQDLTSDLQTTWTNADVGIHQGFTIICKRKWNTKNNFLSRSYGQNNQWVSLTRTCLCHACNLIPIKYTQKQCADKRSPHESNIQDKSSIYAGIHLLLDRKDWHKHPGWKEAIDKELNGILENDTWNYDEVISRKDLVKRNQPIHVGRLMTIFSVKYWEVPELRRLKARIVFRGDDIRDQANNLAVLQEGKINPSGLAGINVNLAYGSLKGHTSSQNDVVRVYT